MVPDQIDELPHHDGDNRQLMLGLIDDFPQERGGTRHLMNWGLGLAIVLFVVLVWVTAPSS